MDPKTEKIYNLELFHQKFIHSIFNITMCHQTKKGNDIEAKNYL